MKTNDIAKHLGTTNQTIGNWIKRFYPYFSNGAKLTESRHRHYTDDDLITLATIAKLSHSGFNYDAIDERLSIGERVASFGEVSYEVDTRMIPSVLVDEMMDANANRLELERLTLERDKLAEWVENLQDQLENRLERQKQEYEKKLAAQDEENRSLQLELRQLIERVGRAEAQVELLRELLNQNKNG